MSRKNLRDASVPPQQSLSRGACTKYKLEQAVVDDGPGIWQSAQMSASSVPVELSLISNNVGQTNEEELSVCGRKLTSESWRMDSKTSLDMIRHLTLIEMNLRATISAQPMRMNLSSNAMSR